MGKTCHATTQYSWTFEYICRSILNFGKIANPLYELLKGQTEKGRKKETSIMEANPWKCTWWFVELIETPTIISVTKLSATIYTAVYIQMYQERDIVAVAGTV